MTAEINADEAAESMRKLHLDMTENPPRGADTLKKACMFLYSAVSGRLDRSTTLHFRPGRPVHSNLDLSGKHSATLQLLHEEYAFTFPSLSKAG